MQNHFTAFRRHIIGIEQTIDTPYAEGMPIVYADWTASGRCYGPIERRLTDSLMPFVANTHTDTNATGSAMTHAYHEARNIIKKHVNASAQDVLISSNAGMTGVINKFQRILGLRVYEKYSHQITMAANDRPVIFVTHMEHHSNQTSWLETIGEVVVVAPDHDGMVCLEKFRSVIERYADRPRKIAAITSCSNVTGLFTPYYEIAEMMHAVGGHCFVDFACSAPYVEIDMHPPGRPAAYLDAIYFSPHKFLGGPGSTGILVFNQALYKNTVPDNPGGGTVDWTNPWGQHKFVDDIEAREDGGTPAFLQTMRVALCIRLKEEMGVQRILEREKDQLKRLFSQLDKIPNLHVLAEKQRDRLGIVSFYIDGLHYNVAVKILNDRYGIQTRGGCSCAGTYGHYLLNVQPETSNEITSQITSGNCASKPGWVRLSVHPTTTDEEIDYMTTALTELAEQHSEWCKDYRINWSSGQIEHLNALPDQALKDRMSHCLTQSLAEEELVVV
jgi:selenocysteine lyase/cysteine desulfurase